MVSVRGITENLIANILWIALAAAFGALAVWLTSLTPIIRLFAPLSYLIAALIVVLLLSVAAYIGARARRMWNPPPAPSTDPALVYELERTKERLKLVEEQLAGTQVATSGKPALTGPERDRASQALTEIVDFATREVTPFYAELSRDTRDPTSFAEKVDRLEPERERLAMMTDRLWTVHAYYLDMMQFDIFMSLLRTLQALQPALGEAKEAKDWPANAQADRVKPVAQLMSDLGGHIGNIRKDAEAKRKEYF